MTCIVSFFLPFMYLSKCSMSPLHNSRPFNTRRLKLARVLLASSISVLVSIHIPAAAGPHQYKTWQMDNNYAATLQGSSYLRLSVLVCVCSSVGSFLLLPLVHLHSPSPPFRSPFPFQCGLRG